MRLGQVGGAGEEGGAGTGGKGGELGGAGTGETGGEVVCLVVHSEADL